MGEREFKVVYLHGIGGATESRQWLDPLNRELAAAGFDTLKSDDVIDFDYSGILQRSRPLADIDEPRATWKSAEEASSEAESEYLARSAKFESIIEKHQLRVSIPEAKVVREPVGDAVGALLSEVRHYAHDEQTRREIWRLVLAELPRRGSIVLIGHSLGSVIAVDLVERLPEELKVSCLITLGSPLGTVGTLRKHSALLARSEGFPFERVFQWVNVYEFRDPVTGGVGISSHYPMALDVPVQTGLPRENHSVNLYASHAVVAWAVGGALWGTGLPATVGPLPARVHPNWNTLLLKFAYAENLHHEIPSKEAKRRRSLRLARQALAREAEKLITEATADTSAEWLALAPTAGDLVDRPTDLLYRSLSIEELVEPCVEMVSSLVLPPFDLEVDASREIKVATLTDLVNRVRRDADRAIDERQFAERCVNAVKTADHLLGVSARHGWVKWALLSATGVVVVGAAALSLGVAAPPTLAGAAAITAALAAIGPGGMAGGIATIAALSGVGMAAAAGGAAGAVGDHSAERRRAEALRRAEIRAAAVELALKGTPEDLKRTLATYVAAVIVREELQLDNQRDAFLAVAEQTLAQVNSNLAVAEVVDPKGGWRHSLSQKQESLVKARDWLRENRQTSLEENARSIESSLADRFRRGGR